MTNHWQDPRTYDKRGLGLAAPDRSVFEELDELDSPSIPDDDDYLEQSPETGHFPHDA